MATLKGETKEPIETVAVKAAALKRHPIQSIRRAAVPLAGFETADPAATIRAILKAVKVEPSDLPVMQWDVVRGWVGIGKAGENFVNSGWYDRQADPFCWDQLVGVVRSGKAGKLIAFVHNCQRYWERDGFAQGIWNCRDAFKEQGATLVLLGPVLMLPGELTQDVVVVTEALPDVESVGSIVDSILADAKAAAEKKGITFPEVDKPKAVDILLGLSAFAAEQACAMSVSREGLDLDSLWERKRRTVEQTPGLTIWRETSADSFNQLGGLANLKEFLKRILCSGRNPIRAIGFIDEIEKGFAGAGGDLSGVSQDQLMVFLKVMQDYNIPGIILVGPGGTGKSAISKAAGAVAGAEVLAIDTGAMTGSLVGESQRKIRAAMEVFKAVSQGKGMFIATCNKIVALPPELRRRFTLGTFYVDLPSAEERKVIWPIWLRNYGIEDKALPECDGWTGAEIRACCDVSFRAGMTLKEASKFVVPVCKSNADSIIKLREMAHGKFISANLPGIYEYKRAEVATVPQGRSMDF